MEILIYTFCRTASILHCQSRILIFNKIPLKLYQNKIKKAFKIRKFLNTLCKFWESRSLKGQARKTNECLRKPCNNFLKLSGSVFSVDSHQNASQTMVDSYSRAVLDGLARNQTPNKCQAWKRKPWKNPWVYLTAYFLKCSLTAYDSCNGHCGRDYVGKVEVIRRSRDGGIWRIQIADFRCDFQNSIWE